MKSIFGKLFVSMPANRRMLLPALMSVLLACADGIAADGDQTGDGRGKEPDSAAVAGEPAQTAGADKVSAAVPTKSTVAENKNTVPPEKTPQEKWIDFQYGPLLENTASQSVDRAFHYLPYPYKDGLRVFTYQYRDPLEKLPIKSWSVDVSQCAGFDNPSDITNISGGFGIFELRWRNPWLNMDYRAARYSRDTNGAKGWLRDVSVHSLTLPEISWPDKNLLFEFGLGAKYAREFDESGDTVGDYWLLSLSQNAEFFPVNPLVLGFNASYGQVVGSGGGLDILEAGVGVGVVFWRAEAIIGYHVMLWGNRKRHGPTFGIKIWL